MGIRVLLLGEDVGGFIFEEVIKEQTGKYAGKKVSITY